MRTSFALQPDLQFKFFLCQELGKLPEEIERMSCIDYQRFVIYYERKHVAEAQAVEEARRASGPGRGRRSIL